MAFEDKDKTIEKEVTSRPVQVRFERNDGKDPPVDVYVVMDVDGHSDHRKVDDEAVAAVWDGPTKKLKAWVLAIIDAVE